MLRCDELPRSKSCAGIKPALSKAEFLRGAFLYVLVTGTLFVSMKDEREPLESGGALPFYYNRARRLEKASEQVRKMYEEPPRKRFGLFSSLVDTKSKAMTFLSIILALLAVLLFMYITPSGEKRLAGNNLVIEMMRYEGRTFIALTKKARSADAWTGVVDISLYDGQEEQSAASSRQIVFTNLPEEEFRWSIPGEHTQFRIVARAEDKKARFTVKVR